MWADICEHNRPALAAALDELIAHLTAMRERLQQEATDGIREVLRRAQAKRRQLGDRK